MPGRGSRVIRDWSRERQQSVPLLVRTARISTGRRRLWSILDATLVLFLFSYKNSLGSALEETKMDIETLGRDEGFARDLEQLDRELEQRERPDVPAPTVDLIAGLVAGLRLVGRPR